MAKLDPEILAHLEWIGFVRPTGLVVSAPALVRTGAILDRRDAEGQRLLRACIAERTLDPKEGPAPYLPDFRSFAGSVLGWSFSPKGYAGTAESPIPPDVEVPLPEYSETLRPDFAVRELEPKDGASPWQLLVQILELNQDFDRVVRDHGKLEASAHNGMERLLRQTRVPVGLLFNGRALRLVSAPRGESSGWLDFRVADMVQTAGRPISSALRLLLSEQRLLALPGHQRLAALLADSRKFQNEVSEKLAEQVLHALYELLRGFQAAHDASKGELLRQVVAEHPDEVYRALLTVILRLVFLLYAEERDMLPEDETFLRYYSLAGLHERLREDAALYPDTMDQRFGAWAQLVALFRMVHDGAATAGMHLPPRHGVLFDPDRFPFLEGRTAGGARQIHERIVPPFVPDGTVYRALEKLLVLDGERISYRALDVEQIGSVYETMMGFRLETATGRSVAIKSQKKQGAPTAVDLDGLLAEAGANRAKWLQDRTDRKLTDSVEKAVAAAATLEDLHAALLQVIDQAATPDLVAQGAMVLQPSEERRRSGSHYTPRELTEPIVRTTLDPLLARLRGEGGRSPKPEAILDLKVCDPAMGSGAFLVEACRYLGDALVEAWRAHDARPTIPPDEDDVVFARRLVAQRCLYGVDRNPVAVDLAKMSLWLATLAKDHALTFVDHALRHGDSLVGLSRRQIEAFHWEADAPHFQAGFEAMKAREHLAKVTQLRQQIRGAGESVTDAELRDLWDQAQFELDEVRLLGDLAVAAYFEADKPREREAKRLEFANAVVSGEAERWRGWLEERRHVESPFVPFHWKIEFLEVFERGGSGFDAFVGNPPFLGGVRISSVFGERYRDMLALLHPEGSSNADLAAHFFRRCFSLLRPSGCFGLLATNTIAQGDTRVLGLQAIVAAGGTIFAATRRFPWPGQAAVVVSIVHVQKPPATVHLAVLNGRQINRITAFLHHTGPDGEPRPLASNAGKSFRGCDVFGIGFVFDDRNKKANSLSDMQELIARDPRSAERIFPYLGGEEFNSNPTLTPNRFIIDFGEMSEAEARRWPDLFSIVEQRVKPARSTVTQRDRRELWWLYATRSPSYRDFVSTHERCLGIATTGNAFAFGFVTGKPVLSTALVTFALDRYAEFCLLQSRVHEVWARFFSSTMKQDLRYAPSDCFETFPFPWSAGEPGPAAVEDAGRNYYEFRASLMVENNEGLTQTYNRFHNDEERHPNIVRLRELHAAMDRAVLDAYGWRDVTPTCEFLLDYEIDEEEWGERKMPYRYRWPDEVRDEVLARLLELNAERAKEEARSAVAATKTGSKKTATKSASKTTQNGDLFS